MTLKSSMSLITRASLAELTAVARPSLALPVRLSLLEPVSPRHSSRCAVHLWNTDAEQPSLQCSNHPDPQDRQVRQRSSIVRFGSLRADRLLERSFVRLLPKRQQMDQLDYLLGNLKWEIQVRKK